MTLHTTPFAPGWLSFDLGHYRPCNSTYCLFPYNKLPDLSHIEWHGDFRWLSSLDDSMNSLMEIYRPDEKTRQETAKRLTYLQDEARSLGLSLPPAFVTLMSSWELQTRIPSSTACYFELAKHFVPCPGQKGAYLLRFLNDQQGVLLWYLYLNRQGDEAVVVAPVGFDTFDINELSEEERQGVIDATYYCGAGFEEFIYRFWLENVLWFALNESDELLTVEQTCYLAHYSAIGKATA